MNQVQNCPRCRRPLIKKEVKELLYGGNNTAFITITVGLCLHCGERLYTPEQVRRFEEIEGKLAQEETTDFHPVGQSFQVT